MTATVQSRKAGPSLSKTLPDWHMGASSWMDGWVTHDESLVLQLNGRLGEAKRGAW